MIVAHLDRGIDVSIKISSDWPLCSYGLKVISIHNSGDRPTNIASTLLSKTKVKSGCCWSGPMPVLIAHCMQECVLNPSEVVEILSEIPVYSKLAVDLH
jgi:hypothetical protein